MLKMVRFTMELVRKLFSNFPKPRSKTGATAESREPTGALPRKPQILTREPSNKRVSCSPKESRKDGATDKSTLKDGAIRRSRMV